MKQLTIGNVSLANPVILAPMAGVSDLPFRLLCHEQGAGMVCSEMISAKAILYHNKNTEELMQIHPDEGPVSLQLFGSDPDIVSEMAKRIEERPFAVMDLNMGCPVPKVVNNGEGSALMKNPLLAGKIIEKTAKAIQKPLTVKIRKGFDDAHVNAVEMAKIAQESGAAAVAVHGRTREQYYSGTAGWGIITQFLLSGAGMLWTRQARCGYLSRPAATALWSDAVHRATRGFSGKFWQRWKIAKFRHAQIARSCTR